MGRNRAGRKKKVGDRYAGGRLKQAWDYGCEGVQRRRAMYQPTAANDAGKIDANHTFDAIGRAWSAGLLDGQGVDPAVLRDAGRELGALYWRIFGLGSQDSLAKFIPKTGSAGDRERALENALNHRLLVIRQLGGNVRRAVDALCIGDGMMFDTGPVWLDRLIWAKRREHAADERDAGMMRLALIGLGGIT